MLKKSLLLMLLMTLLVPWAVNAQETLTVCNGTKTNSRIPINGLYVDTQGTTSEFIIPANELSDIAGGTISKVTFYISSIPGTWGNPTIQLYIGEVEGTTLSGINGPSSFTIVNTSVWSNQSSTIEVEFDDPYTYGGGNLLIGTYVQTKSSTYKTTYFYGVDAESGASRYNTGSGNGTAQSFLPTTTLTYEMPSGDCDMPTDILVSNITPDGATVTWEGTGSNWNLRYKASSDAEYTMVNGLTTTTYNLSSLTSNTTYSVGVQTVCTGSTSSFKSTSFTTPDPCAAPTNLQFKNITSSSATLTWEAGYQETTWTVKYKKSTDTEYKNEETVNGTPTVTLSGLDGLTTYNVQVINCENYVSGNFTTAASIPLNEGFATSSAPTGWTRYNALLSTVMGGGSMGNAITSGWNFGTGNGVFDSHAKVNIYGTSCKYWLVTPTLPMEDNVQLTFDLALTKYSGTLQPIDKTLGEDDRFVMLITTDNMATWTILREWNNTGSEYVYNDIACTATGQSVAIDLSSYAGQNIAIAFYGESTVDETGSDNNLHIDNVSIDYIPSCAKPTGLAAANPYGHGATLSWTSDASAWVVAYQTGKEDFVEIDVTENPYTFSGLNPETTYTAKVKANCGGAYSEYTNTVSFTTTVACPAPTGLAAALTPGNGTVATLSWTETGEATNWVVEYDTDSEFKTATSVNVSETPTANLTGLTAETTYYARVKAACGGIDGESAWSNTISFTPTNAYMLTVNDGTATNSLVPIYGSWTDNHSNSQFIIPAADIAGMQWGTINKMTFYAEADKNWGAADFEVYIGETSETTLSGLVDWESLEKVMNAASLSIVDKVMEITLDAPYQYMGSNLLIGIYQPTSGTYSGCSWYGVSAASGSSVGGYGGNASAQSFLPKTTFAYTPGEAPSCIKPTGLTVNYTGGTTAEVSWTSEASAWNLRVNGTLVEDEITNPYTLTGLELATTYEVEVQADCGGSGTSDWTSAVSFTTDLCLPADMCTITIVLTDSYGDGWNGNYMSVVDKATSEELGTYTIASGSTETFTLSVCNGRTIDFVFTGTNYPTENGWVITDVNDEVITEREGCNSGCDPEQGIQATYTVDCTVTTCKKPTDLAATEIGGHSAKLSWTENGEAEAWVVSYTTDGENFTHVNASTNPYTLAGLNPETTYGVIVTPVCEVDKPSEMIVFITDEACPAPSALTANTTPFTAELSWLGFGENYDIQYAEIPSSKDGLWLQYDDNTYVTGIGSSTSGSRTWGVRYPANMLQLNNTLTKVSIYESATYYTCASYTVNIYQGAEQPETLLGTETVVPSGTTGMHEITLSSAISINPTQNLWITLTVEGTYVMLACQVNNRDNQWWDNNGDGVWTNMGDDNAGLADYGWMIRGYVEGFDPSAYTWTTITGVDTPYTITGLEPETSYAYRVKSNCGDEGNSDWSSYCVFTTASACDTPFDLVSEPLDETATLSWTGYQDKYNVKYRTAATYSGPIWFDDFEDGLAEWTILHGEEATCPSGGYWYTIDPSDGLSFESHSGDYCASSWSWNSSAYNADNYLVTPQINLGGAIKFWVRTNAGYPDSYEVLLSTTGNTIVDFTTTLQAMAPAPNNGEWNEVTIDLTAYSGTGYIAIHHEDYDANYLVIDDFGVYDYTPAGAWVTDNNVANPHAIATDPSTTYEWQVQGITKCTGGLTEWSEMATFTTYSVVYDDEIWEPGETDYTDDVIVVHDVYIESDAVVYANSVTLATGAQLIIEDGGQLYHNEPVEATYLKEIDPYTAKDGDGWYLIASPVNNAKISDLFEGTFDLFKYDEPTAYWYAYNDGHPFNKLSLGTGYLHASAAYKMVEITGEMIGTQDPDMAIALSYAGTDADLKGFNLIGNPFTRNITPDNMVIYDGTLDMETPVSTYYGMNDTRTDFMPLILSATNPIKPGEGFFIQASGDDQYVVFNPSTSSKDVYNGYISIVAGNESYSDMAYVQLGYGNTLRKMSMSDNTSVCVINNGDDYASARVEELEGMMPVNFKAASTGLYTISIKANDIETGMMHLIDNFTGVDIDLMAYPSYTFQATEFDSEERFTLVFDFNTYTGVNENYAEGNFVYQSGDELYISGDGTLEVFDVMGRFVASYEMSGSKRISTSQFNTGVYVFRMVGETMMTQKIVVR